MEWWQAIVLGIVEGLTEYLPVSSTGHLILAQRAMGIAEGDAANAYAICIQGGAIVAVLGLYWRRVRQMLLGLLGRDPAGLRLFANIVCGFVPAAVIGLLLEDTIKHYLFGGERWGLWPTVAAWLVGGIAILALAKRQSPESRVPGPESGSTSGDLGLGTRDSGLDLLDLTWRGALVIGFVQCVAMWPGVSRSLATIVGGLLVGMRLTAAVEFSFLLGVATLGAATCYDGLKHGETILAAYGPGEIFLGFLFAWISAVLAVKWMVEYLKRHGLRVFGYYRVALAVVVAALIVTGPLAAASPSPEPGLPAPSEQLPDGATAPAAP